MSDRLATMSILVACVDAGSLTAGARRLGMPLATVSRRVAALEEQIGTNDIAWVTMDSAHVPTGVARTTAELTGMAVRRPLPAGDMVLVSDLEPPVVVARGSGVMITYTSGPLTILMRGRALEDGALGSVVRVANADSGRTVDAVVSGPGSVEANASVFIIN